MSYHKILIFQSQQAVIALIFTAAGYSLLGMVARILGTGFAPMTQVYVRVLLGFIVSLVLFHKQINIQRLRTVTRSDWFWLMVMGVVGYALGVWAITRANISAKLVNSSVIYATIPFVVYIYAFFILKEKIRLRLVGLLFISLYGISVVAAKSFVPVISDFGIGELWAVVSVLASGFWSIGIKKLSGYLNSREVTMIVMAIAGLAGLIIALSMGEPLPLISFMDPLIWAGLALGAVLNVILTWGENFSFRHLDVVVGSQILMSSTVFSLIVGYIFYHETISFPEVAGGGIILTTVFTANRWLKHLL